MSSRTMQSFFLILMGSLDCLTTVIGTMNFGTRELNPLIAGLVNTNLLAFVVIKLAVTVVVALIFVLAQKTLMQTEKKDSESYRIVSKTLKFAYFGLAMFLAVVVINSILTLAQFLL